MYRSNQLDNASKAPYFSVPGFPAMGHQFFRGNLHPDLVYSDTASNVSRPQPSISDPRALLPAYQNRCGNVWPSDSSHGYNESLGIFPHETPFFTNQQKPLQGLPQNFVGSLSSTPSEYHWPQRTMMPLQTPDPRQMFASSTSDQLLHHERLCSNSLPNVFSLNDRQNHGDPSLKACFNYLKAHLANILLSHQDNNFSAGNRQERLHYSVLEAICYLVDRLFETVVIGSSETVSAHLLDSSVSSSSVDRDEEVPRLSKVLPSDISTFLQTHFGFSLKDDEDEQQHVESRAQ